MNACVDSSMRGLTISQAPSQTITKVDSLDHDSEVREVDLAHPHSKGTEEATLCKREPSLNMKCTKNLTISEGRVIKPLSSKMRSTLKVR